MDNLNLSYKQLHETFMQNHTGTSVGETILIQSPIPFVIFLSVCVVRCIGKYERLFSIFNFGLIQFFVEFLVIVVSQIVIFTLPDYNWYICFFIYAFGICAILVVVLNFITKTDIKKETFVSLRNTLFTGNRLFITYYRTSVNLTTTICILAVDFTSFPRTLAKTETFGFSLMDTGVGYFVVCNALVGRHKYKNDSWKSEQFLYDQLRQNFILLVLGLSRIFFTKSVDYQSHNTEYGVHWNFFLTLAFVRFLSTFLLTHISVHHVKYLTFGIITLHQLILIFGAQNWVMGNTPRDNLLSANREGIVSILGYVGLYLLSVEIRNRLIMKVSTFEKDVILLVKLILSTIVFYLSVLLLNHYLPGSRRLVNVTYIAWIVMQSLYLLSFCLFFEIISRLFNSPENIQDSSKLVPGILKSVNYNGLSYFLMANVLTGIVNVSIETLYVSNIYSILILSLYMFTACSITRYLYYKNVKII